MLKKYKNVISRMNHCCWCIFACIAAIISCIRFSSASFSKSILSLSLVAAPLSSTILQRNPQYKFTRSTSDSRVALRHAAPS